MEKLDFKIENYVERKYYSQDFTPMGELLKRIRTALVTGGNVDISGINLDGIFDYIPSLSFTYITLFQEHTAPIRWGSRKKDLAATIDRNLEKIRENKSFEKFNVADENKCRIMLEFVSEKKPVKYVDLQQTKFNENRFEIGVNGLELKQGNLSWYYMPTDAVLQSHLGLSAVVKALLRKSPIAKLTTIVSERIRILKTSGEYELFLLKSRAFVTYKDGCVPLYRGNILYPEFSYETLLDQFIKTSDWLVDTMYDDGRFLYYYDAATDSRKDHEHPSRKEDNLYYNDLRHCGGAITLIKTYLQTKDKKYLDAAKRAIDWTTTIVREHDVNGQTAMYAHYNNKGKLGGTGLALIMMMQYRTVTGDKSYDKYIKGFARHLISRITESGEMLGYYIHPSYQDGKPLITMSEQERKETFSFYYPGEALFGLALFVKDFEDDTELVDEVKTNCHRALDWIVNERPKIYGEQFTALPSDAWLMQAIDTWVDIDGFKKDDYINFVLTDANTMVEKMYTEDDSPYLDYDGGFYYNYGDHYFPDGARSEGLISGYYLARRLGKDALADGLLAACKKAAKSQFSLFNCEECTYAHPNPQKSFRSIRFKATRQWVRVDSIQHVACFFIRLYWAEHPLS